MNAVHACPPPPPPDGPALGSPAVMDEAAQAAASLPRSVSIAGAGAGAGSDQSHRPPRGVDAITISSSPVEAFPSPPRAPNPSAPSPRRSAQKPRPLQVIASNKLPSQPSFNFDSRHASLGGRDVKPRSTAHPEPPGTNDVDGGDDEYGSDLDDATLARLVELEEQTTRTATVSPAPPAAPEASTIRSAPLKISSPLRDLFPAEQIKAEPALRASPPTAAAAAESISRRAESEVDELDEPSVLSQEQMLDFVSRGCTEEEAAAPATAQPGTAGSAAPAADLDSGSISDLPLCATSGRSSRGARTSRQKLPLKKKATKRAKTASQGRVATVSRVRGTVQEVVLETRASKRKKASTPLATTKTRKTASSTTPGPGAATSSTLPGPVASTLPTDVYPTPSAAPSDGHGQLLLLHPAAVQADCLRPVFDEVHAALGELQRRSAQQVQVLQGEIAKRDLIISQLEDELALARGARRASRSRSVSGTT
ncbi:uncharacterized protein PFL1_05378 [Pseudozyma flocculosa PF-1]|uniref:Uncharacterized protein n=2 Tax=Pseudozyma flocculosa TaxID=84751 RepID=A0A5C3FA58_9BASI|nr:uncharacterized protein PFL1_05378 [Pseudozyma flocculosa PF-1]EPQ27094.1 hypothetical protein PFL1_05378 [Pseudozyma flocculosa PF-1]SPO41338.1 uncharacterized protein PSFLO_06820 [Pseudozyma flocculosa]